MENANKISRRAFVSASAASIVATAASANRVLGANNRLRIGIIGCGGLAQGAHIPSLMKMKEADNIEIAAVCDVYQKRLDQAAATTGATPIKDYRAILDRKDIDYVAIVTPEHWHARMTLDAADAGKHIYCEKPMTWSIEQAKQVVKKIQQTNVKMQVGVQGMCDDSYETAQKYVKEGKLGRVVQAQIDYSRNYKRDFWVSDEPDKDVRPGENLDWNAFLGPAPKRPFDLDRFLHWRRYWDYSGGIATDLFVHRITRVIRAQGRFNKEGDKPEIVHKRTGREDITLHHRNLQNAIRGGEALKCDVMTGYYGIVAVRLAVESYRWSKN